MEERWKELVWMKVRVEGVSQTGPCRLAKAAAIIEHIIVIVPIRSLNYIQQKDRTAQQGRSCYHLDHAKEWCLPIVFKLPFNRESCDSGFIASIGHDCCPSAVFTEGAQRRVWTTSNPLKYEQTHWIPRKAGDNLERAHIIRHTICSLFVNPCKQHYWLHKWHRKSVTNNQCTSYASLTQSFDFMWGPAWQFF